MKKWNLPLCVGAIDGKHVRIQKPPKSGSTFYNYKHFFSVNIMAVCDADYKFQFVEVGAQGRLCDGSVWNSCRMKEAIDRKIINLPGPSSLPSMPDGSFRLTHYFAADDAFAMSEHIMKPYSHRELTPSQRVYNYRYSVFTHGCHLIFYISFWHLQIISWSPMY